MKTINKLSNLMQIKLAINECKNEKITLKNLISIEIENNNFVNSINATLNKNKIENLKIPTLGNNFELKTLNSLENLKSLEIGQLRMNDLEEPKISLPRLENFYCNSKYPITIISDSPKLKSIYGKIDTELDYSNIKNNLEEITFTNEEAINIDNVNTKKTKRIRISSPNFTISKKCEKLISLEIFNHYFHSDNDIDNTIKSLNISKLNYFPNLQNFLSLRVTINDDSESLKPHTSLKNILNYKSNTSSINFVSKLQNLENLSIVDSQVENIEILEELEKLKEANLSSNRIIGIPAALSNKFDITVAGDDSLFDLTTSPSKRKLYIGDNPLISPPIEIVERGDNAVRPYFNSMTGKMEELNEAKIIFLGNGEVGKTSLMKALSGENFDPEESTTHGINICKYNVPINEQRSIDASIWDFGGQQIMHATHQLFLSRRCIYVLVINDRRDDLQQEQKIEYWLQQVQTFGGDSKVILIRNKYDMFMQNNVSEGILQEKFPNLVCIEAVSCKTGHNIERVKNLLNEQVRQLPMRKVCLAENWIKIKNEIKSISNEKDHLPLSTYNEICINNGVTDKEAQKTLRQLLHDLSVIIAFEELSDFDMGILNPHWITDGIYTIISSNSLEKNKGYIKINEIQQELDKAHPKKYTNKARFIIESMMQFELCHLVGSSKSHTYLVPNLLPNEIKDRSLKFGKNLIRFQFKYNNLLPPALFPKFLVRMNSQITSDKRWRTGAILTDANLDVQARVELDSVAKEINIVVSGTQTRDFFSVIRHNIRSLNTPSVEALGVRELVPLQAEGCSEYVDYEELIGLELMAKTEYTSGKLRKSFSVSKLLNGIESRDETERSLARQREEINVNIELKTGDVTLKTGDITNSFTSNSDQTQTATQSQKIDISLELKGLKGTVQYVFNDLKEEAEYEIDNEQDRKRFIRECEKTEKAFESIENIDTPEKANENLGLFSRVKDFLTNALDGSGTVGDAMKSLGDNVSKVRDVAKQYNKVAIYLGLPTIPDILL